MDEVNGYLWAGTSLPNWDAGECYRLFLRQRACGPIPATVSERDQFARLLMRLISIRFVRHKWLRDLPRARLSAPDVAADVLTHLLRKAPTMSVRVIDDASKPEREKVLAFLGVLNTSIFRRVMSVITAKASARRPANATDAVCRRGRSGEQDRTMTSFVSAAVDTQERDLQNLAKTLASAEDAVCGDVPGDINDIVVLFRFCRRLILRGNANLTAWKHLPHRLRTRVRPEQHALVISRTFRVVESVADQLQEGRRAA